MASVIPKNLVGLTVALVEVRMCIYSRIQVTVGHKKIQIAVVVIVQKTRAPAKRAVGRLHKTAPLTHIFEIGPLNIFIQRAVVKCEIGDKKIRISVVVIISRTHPHPGLRFPGSGKGKSCPEGHVRKCPVPVVAVIKIGIRIVGHIKIGPAVAIGIGCTDSVAVGKGGVCQSGLFGDVCERAIPIVAIKNIRCPIHPHRTRRDLHCPPPEQALLCISNILHRTCHIIRHIEIYVSIGIKIQKRGIARPGIALYPCILRHLSKRPIPVVAIKQIGAKISDIKIWSSVVIIIRNANPAAPAPVSNSAQLGHILKRPVSPVAIKCIGAFHLGSAVF